MENIENKVIDFFKQHLVNINHFDRSTIINFPDLLVDDGEIFLQEFIKKFDIKDCSLDFDKYFNPIKNPFITLFDYIRNRQRTQKTPIIRIGHMIEVAKKKEWFEPDGSDMSHNG